MIGKLSLVLWLFMLATTTFNIYNLYTEYRQAEDKRAWLLDGAKYIGFFFYIFAPLIITGILLKYFN